MKGLHFYEEFHDEERSEPVGTVIAIATSHESLVLTHSYECVAAISLREDAPVSGGHVSPEYLEKRCRRVSERKARSIHPRLFEYLREEKR